MALSATTSRGKRFRVLVFYVFPGFRFSILVFWVFPGFGIIVFLGISYIVCIFIKEERPISKKKQYKKTPKTIPTKKQKYKKQ